MCASHADRRSGTLVLKAETEAASDLEVPLLGAVGTARPRVFPRKLSFGIRQAGRAAIATVTVRNTRGTLPAFISASVLRDRPRIASIGDGSIGAESNGEMSAQHSDFTIAEAAGVVGPGEEASVDVRFRPSADHGSGLWAKGYLCVWWSEVRGEARPGPGYVGIFFFLFVFFFFVFHIYILFG